MSSEQKGGHLQAKQRDLRRNQNCLHLNWFYLLEPWENSFLLFQSPGLEFCYSSPRKLIHGHNVISKSTSQLYRTRWKCSETGEVSHLYMAFHLTLDSSTASCDTLLQVNCCRSWKTFKFLLLYILRLLYYCSFIWCLYHLPRRLNIRIYMFLFKRCL